MISLVFGLVGGLCILFQTLMTLPIIATVFGFYALYSLKRYPDELTGKIPATLGTFLGVSLTIAGIAYHSYVYVTEVPEGFQRITFSQLQPEKYGQILPPDAPKLNQQKIFIKGYMHPSGTQGMGDVQKFILVPDMGTCCFGGQPKLTDMVEVTLSDNLKTQYSRRQKKLAGLFTVDAEIKEVSGLQGVYYQLDANYVK